MAGVITSIPPLVEQPPGQSSNNPAGLPGVTYTAAIPTLANTWSGLQTFNNGSVQFAGSTSGNTFLNATAIASGTLTLPAATDTLVGRNTVDTLTNKTLTAPILTTPNLGIATATTINKYTFTTPATAATLTILDGKTATFNNSISFAGIDATTLTFQGTDTYIGRATTDTLTNKTYDTGGAGNALSIAGVAVTANTGTGAIVRATSPAITTPTGIVKGDVGLGNVANVDTTNAANISSGTLPAARLPNPSATTLGGVQSLAAVASKWINTISTSGVPSATQPAFADISGQATLAQLPTIGANTVLGSIAGGTPIALTTAQHTSLVNAFTTTLNGSVPNPGTVASKFLRDDGTWQAVAGAGTVTSVATGVGLKGGPITASGTLSIDASYMRSYLSGLTLSTAGGTSSFGIAVGVATDSTNADMMALGSAYTKSYGAWSLGTAGGALDTGAAAINTWYHVYIIKRPDTGVVDVLISLSATAPTMPTNYTLFRRIGSMKINGSSAWTKFIQIGDDFLWDAAVLDVSNSATITTTNTAYTLASVPTGVSVMARIRATFSNSAGPAFALLSSPLTTAQIGGTPTANHNINSQGAGQNIDLDTQIWTNTSAQINASASSAANNGLYINTYGWIDRRGRDA